MKKDSNKKTVVETGKTTPKKIEEAVTLLKESSKVKFVASIDIDILLNIKEKNLKDNVKGTLTLPNKVGQDKKVVVLCESNDVEPAKKAGATMAGLDDVMDKILEGWMDFDVLLATPQVMPKIVKIGKLLGPKGMMPSPKSETIVTDVEKAVKSFIGGKSSFRMIQGQGAIRGRVAKVDMTDEQIVDNVLTYVQSVLSETKKYGQNPFKKMSLSTTMGPSVKLDISDIIKRIS